MNKQNFERLIKLEDEELVMDDDSISDSRHLSEKDYCKVPMISNGGNETSIDSIENLFPGIKHKPVNRSLNVGGGFQFNINGRHIRINPEQLKYLSLITLTIQNAALNLTMRAAKTQSEQFSTPVAVTVAEILKLITCTLLVLYEEASIGKAIHSIKLNIVENYVDTLKVAVPSFVYYVQNNLLYVGSTHLDAATGQVTYQLKILTTAIFSVLMLNKKLSKIQWLALVTLFIGVALIETIVVTDHKPHDQLNATSHNVSPSSHNHETTAGKRSERPLVGFLAILSACCLSGFAGVYFEKILKDTSHVSLWIRNIQLSVVAIPIGLIQVLFVEYNYSSNNGLLHGFTPLTWLCIILQVQGGLLVAVVVKFANNILKGFATSMAIVISTVASIFLFDFNLTPVFMVGASLVIGSVMMYNKQ